MAGTELMKVEGALTVADVTAQVNLIQEIMKNVMKKDQHYGQIPGCGEKMVLLKPGADKLAFTFRLRPIIDNAKDVTYIDLGNGHYDIRVFCHIQNAEGKELATGVGSCSTKETKYRYRGGEKKGTGKPVPKEYWNLKREGKIQEAASLIGGKGFGPGKINGDWQICEVGSKMENTDIADEYNTVLKMAKKRANIDGILSATAASDIFTQDLEDKQPEHSEETEPGDIGNGKPRTQTGTGVMEGKAAELISEQQLKMLRARANDAKIDLAQIQAHIKEKYGYDDLAKIQKGRFDDILLWLKAIPKEGLPPKEHQGESHLGQKGFISHPQFDAIHKIAKQKGWEDEDLVYKIQTVCQIPRVEKIGDISDLTGPEASIVITELGNGGR